jgi:hypothetical protein
MPSLLISILAVIGALFVVAMVVGCIFAAIEEMGRRSR